MDAITAISRRVSVRRFRSDPVPRDVIEQLLDAAVRAPNHKLTEPWRFVVLTGGAKDRVAMIRAAHRLKRFENPDSPEARAASDKVLREAADVPVYIVVLSAENADEITREEDYAATMMAVTNLMIAAESLGLGTYLRTGGVLRDAALAELIELPDHYRIVGLLSLGYPAEQEPPRRRKPASQLTRWLDR
jgi:nitroreductase